MRELVCGLLGVALAILIARAVVSWFPSVRDSAVGRTLDRITDPVLTPVRQAIPPIRMGGGALDLSTIIVALAIGMVRSLIC